MKSLQVGLWSGVMATGPMTAALFYLNRTLDSEEQKPLPPAMLSNDFLEVLGLADKMTPAQRENFTMVSHFGYGAACGAIYSLLTSKYKSSPITKGTVFGLAVWSASYLGWMPPLNLRTSAPNMSKGRNAMMFLAHIAWGASLGFFENQMRQRQDQMLDGKDADKIKTHRQRLDP